MPNSLDLTHGPWTREDLEEMWESMQAVLPKDAFRDFRSYVPFTDGEGETVAYVLPGRGGSQWEICLDPADMGGPGLFSGDRAPRVLPLPHPEPPSGGLSGEPTVETYCEAGMVSREGPIWTTSASSSGPATWMTGWRIWTAITSSCGMRRISSAATPPPTRRRTSARLRLLRAVGRAGVGGGVGGEAAVFPGLPGADGVPPPGAGEPGAGAAGAGGIKCRMPGGTRASGHIFMGRQERSGGGCGGTRGGQSPPGW